AGLQRRPVTCPPPQVCARGASQTVEVYPALQVETAIVGGCVASELLGLRAIRRKLVGEPGSRPAQGLEQAGPLVKKCADRAHLQIVIRTVVVAGGPLSASLGREQQPPEILAQPCLEVR